MGSWHGDRLSGRKKRKPGEQRQGWNCWEREGHIRNESFSALRTRECVQESL